MIYRASQMVKRISGRVIVWSVLGWGTAVGAQSLESPESWASFTAAFQRKDFTAIETKYSSLIASDKRSLRGDFIAETYAVLWSLASCANFPTPNDEPPKGPYAELRIDCWNTVEAKVNEWSLAYPLSTLSAVGLAEINLARAQSPEILKIDGAKAQDDFAESARRTLENVPIDRRTVTLYLALMRTATLQGWGAKRFDQLMTEAASKFPNHPLIYRRATVHYLPKNGGSPAEIEKIAQFAVDKTKAQDGDSMYAHVYDEVILGQGRMWGEAQRRTYFSWPKMRKGLGDIHSRFPDKWNLNRFAQHACLVDDLVTLSALLGQIGSETKPGANDGWMAGELLRCRKKLLVPRPESNLTAAR